MTQTTQFMPGNGKCRTAFVLPGGGSFGAIQVGMLRALVENNLVPDFVVGASVGALNSAYFCAAADPEGVRRLEQIWRGLRRKDVFPTGMAWLARLVWRGNASIATSGLLALIEKHLPYSRIEDAPIPLYILATDFISGAPVVLSEGALGEAILASAAIPAAFPPVMIGGRYLADGALAHKTPLMVAADLGATRIVLLPVGFACAITEPPHGAIANAMHAVTLMMARQLFADVRILGSRVEISVVPPLCPLKGSPYSFDNTAGLIDRAYDSTAAWIASGQHESCDLPQALFPHSH